MPIAPALVLVVATGVLFAAHSRMTVAAVRRRMPPRVRIGGQPADRPRGW
jgi:hypothetical protein